MVATWRASKSKFGFHISEPYAKIQNGVPRSHGASRPRADARRHRAAGKVRIRFRVAHLADEALDAHLPLELLPQERERCRGVRRELAALAALVVGVEDEALGIHALQEHDPSRGPAI